MSSSSAVRPTRGRKRDDGVDRPAPASARGLVDRRLEQAARLLLAGTACYGVASVVYLLANSMPPILLGASSTASAWPATPQLPVRTLPTSRPATTGRGDGPILDGAGVGLISGPAIGFFVISTFATRNLLLGRSAGGRGHRLSIFAKERRGRQSPRAGPLARASVGPGRTARGWVALCLGLAFGPLLAFLAIFAQGRGIV